MRKCLKRVYAGEVSRVPGRRLRRVKSRCRYPTDLTDAEWVLLGPLVPPPKPGGRPCCWSRRALLDGPFYALRSGCAWRLLPHDLPPWQTVYHYFRLWRRDGTLEGIPT